MHQIPQGGESFSHSAGVRWQKLIFFFFPALPDPTGNNREGGDQFLVTSKKYNFTSSYPFTLRASEVS